MQRAGNYRKGCETPRCRCHSTPQLIIPSSWPSSSTPKVCMYRTYTRSRSLLRTSLTTACQWNTMKTFILAGLYATLLPAYSASDTAVTLPEYPSVSLPLQPLFNNKGVSTTGPNSTANFDRKGGAYDSRFLPRGPWEYDGITVSFMPPFPGFSAYPIHSLHYPPRGM
jgi:hypothetical protein